MATTWYPIALEKMMKGDLDLENADIRSLVLKADQTFDEADDFVDDVSADEMDAVGYARQALANQAVARVDASNRVEFTFDQIDFGDVASGQTAHKVILYVHVTNDTDSYLVAVDDLAANKPTTGDALTYDHHANGYTMTRVEN